MALVLRKEVDCFCDWRFWNWQYILNAQWMSYLNSHWFFISPYCNIPRAGKETKLKKKKRGGTTRHSYEARDSWPALSNQWWTGQRVGAEGIGGAVCLMGWWSSRPSVLTARVLQHRVPRRAQMPPVRHLHRITGWWSQERPPRTRGPGMTNGFRLGVTEWLIGQLR